jgi:hypothetical protein
MTGKLIRFPRAFSTIEQAVAEFCDLGFPDLPERVRRRRRR